MRKVVLKLFNDDDTGEYGVAHANAIDIESPFNAFWNGIGIFHDVFEHWFEDAHPCFRGRYAFNIGGEIAAMGAMAYYVYDIGLWRERDISPSSIYTMEEKMISSTHSHMVESVYYGYMGYGDELLSNVPKQCHKSYSLENLIDQHLYKIDNLRKDFASRKREVFDEYEHALRYKKSINYSTIRNLYRWGYQTSKDLVEDSAESHDVLSDFIAKWQRFTKENDAEQLSSWLSHLIFEIEEGVPNWKAFFMTKEGRQLVPYDRLEYFEYE